MQLYQQIIWKEKRGKEHVYNENFYETLIFPIKCTNIGDEIQDGILDQKNFTGNEPLSQKMSQIFRIFLFCNDNKVGETMWQQL